MIVIDYQLVSTYFWSQISVLSEEEAEFLLELSRLDGKARVDYNFGSFLVMERT